MHGEMEGQGAKRSPTPNAHRAWLSGHIQPCQELCPQQDGDRACSEAPRPAAPWPWKVLPVLLTEWFPAEIRDRLPSFPSLPPDRGDKARGGLFGYKDGASQSSAQTCFFLESWKKQSSKPLAASQLLPESRSRNSDQQLRTHARPVPRSRSTRRTGAQPRADSVIHPHSHQVKAGVSLGQAGHFIQLPAQRL